MAYEYDRIEREDGGGSFLMGLLAGTVLGAGLGMLFAPKAGADTRRQLPSRRTACVRPPVRPTSRRRTRSPRRLSRRRRSSPGVREGQPDRRSRPRGLRSRPHRRSVRVAGDGDRHDRLSVVGSHQPGMTEKTATTIANGVLAAAAIGAAYVVLRIAVATAHGGRARGDGAHGRAAGVVRPRAAHGLGGERAGPQAFARRRDMMPG